MATDPTLDALTGDQRNAYTAVTSMLQQFGLASLAPQLLNFVQQGFSTDTISLELQNTKEWKARFPANDARVKAGMAPLTPSEYIATERSYRQIMQQAGLPSGFYDSNADFTNFISKDVSPQEVQQRVTEASKFVQNQDPQQLAYFRQHYSNGDMIAYALDPTRAEPLVGKAFQASTIGGDAASNGLQLGQQTAEQLANAGVTGGQAQSGFNEIGQQQPLLNHLAALSGQGPLSTDQLTQAAFLGNAAVNTQVDALKSQERARFGGSSATVSKSLAAPTGGF